MRITIHQPEHLVWLGLLNKINSVDVFVILDSVQFEKNNYQNRNRIRTKEGWTWITVPVAKHPLHTKIRDIRISDTTDWIPRYLDILTLHYKKTPFFQEHFPSLKEIIHKKHACVADLNIELLSYAMEVFSIRPKRIVRASELTPSESTGGSNVVLSICKALDTTTYLSGPSGKEYLRLADFEESGITVDFHQFAHPTYPQITEPFLPYMSFIDALFMIGPKETERLIKNNSSVL